jgi:Tol biopolymer transport system component
MPHPNATPQLAISSLLVVLMLTSFCPSAIPQAQYSNDQGSSTVQFVYYKGAKIPLAMDAPPRKNIYSVTTENAEERQLTSDGHSFNPVLSPDGTRVAYLHVTADTCEDCLVPPKYEINVMNADGTTPHTLASIDRPVLLSWSPDGRTLVYGGLALIVRQFGNGLPDLDSMSETARLDSSAYPLYQIKPDGDMPARLLAENAAGLFNKLEWSPDGKWIAYICRSPRVADKSRFRVCLLGTAGQQAQSRFLTDETLCLGRHSWSPDGTGIVYSVFGPQASKVHKGAYQLFVVRTDGSAPSLLTTSDEGRTPQWSPDGKTIVFCDREKKKSLIEAINADGTGKIRLTDPKLNASAPVWSPDGKELAFTAPVHGKLQVHLMNSDGSQLRVLTQDRKLSCSNVTWLRNTRLLLLLCGQTVAPYGATFGTFVDGEYFLISADDAVGMPHQLAQHGAMAISFALEAKPEEQKPSSTH